MTVTDPAGKWKTFTSDAFGNLKQVTEPNPAGGANHETYYTYDVLRHLTQAQMTRGTVTQYRTWVYDSTTQRLTSVTHPESGTTSFDYDSDGRLWHKYNANGTSLTYSYDSFHRVTGISDSAAPNCQSVAFSYDVNGRDYPSQQTNTWGRLTRAQWGGTSCAGNPVPYAEYYGYSTAGQTTYKALWVKTDPNLPAAIASGTYGYNNEGQLGGVSATIGSSVISYGYSFDTMGRLSGMGGGATVTGVAYNAAGQITQATFNGVAEAWSYNERNQVTRHIVSGQMDIGYQYSATQNNGQIEARLNYLSGETVTYTYDSLNRLISASTNGPDWGLSFSYDGFGNRTAQTLTKGSGPPNQTLAFDANNRVVGHSYDGNGNTTSIPGMLSSTSYDASNRLLTANGTDTYRYGPDNRRVYKNGKYYLYTPGGALLAVMQAGANGQGSPEFQLVQGFYYFGGREVTRIEDRLGTVQGGGAKYYPYGEEYNTANERVKFATYWRDGSTGLDYAHNRYYASSMARFVTADPYGGSGKPGDPQSWNRYAYSLGDPVNQNDPAGLESYYMMNVWTPQHEAEVEAAAGESESEDGPPPRLSCQVNGVWFTDTLCELLFPPGSPQQQQYDKELPSVEERRERRITPRLLQALQDAFDALSKVNCNSLFGLAPNSFDPQWLLTSLATGTSGYGYFQIAPIISKPGTVTSATTVGTPLTPVDIGSGATQLVSTGAVITINSIAGSL